MASNGVLVSSYTARLNELTHNSVKIPMYQNPYDARELCKKMLKEENLRNDIIMASNEFINKFGRWQDNLEQIQSYTDIKITNAKESEGNYDCIRYDLHKDKNKNHFKARFKSVAYGLLYLYYHLPLVYDIVGKQARYKTYKSMLKYNDELKDTMKQIL